MKRAAIFTLLCVFLAFVATDIVSREVFERLPHLEDEFTYLYQARIFERGQIAIDTPEPARPYWQPFVITLGGQRFGKYTPGWPLLLALGDGIGQPWIVNAWLMMLTVALVYRLGRELYSPGAGAVAALLTAASPAALLLAGSLMSHTAGLFFTMLFLYALWRVERDTLRRAARGRRALAWGLLGGFALGMLILTRPLTAVGVAAPCVLYSLGRVAWAAVRRRATFWRTLRPLVALGVMTLALALLWPLFNYAVTADEGESFPHYLGRFAQGDEKTNLYLYIWSYDKAGFGPGHGRRAGGHTLERGWVHARADLKCAARDLFGIALPPEEGLTVEEDACLVSSPGYSWVLLIPGFVLWAWRRWTWLLVAVPLSLIAIYLTYWIGGDLYSARYYSEAIGVAALLGGAGVAALARLAKRYARGWLRPDLAIYALAVALAGYALAIYAPARLEPLRGYGRISGDQLAELQAMRQDPDRPVVVIAYGSHHWRDVGAYMGVTSPFRDSDIVLARDQDAVYLDRLRMDWADREQLFFVDGALTHEPPSEPPPD